LEQEKLKSEQETKKLEQLRQKEEEEKRKLLEQIEASKILAEQERKKEEERKRQQEELLKEKEKMEKQEKMRSLKGFLSKKGHIVKNWKVRFCQIKNGEISYFEDSSMKKLKGKFSLSEASVEVEENPIEGNKFCFIIILKQGKKFVFSASSEAERTEWVNSVEFVSNETIEL